MCDCCTSAPQHAVGKQREMDRFHTKSSKNDNLELVHTSLVRNEWAMKYVLQQAHMLSIFRVQSMLCSVEGCNLCINTVLTQLKGFVSIFTSWIIRGRSRTSVNKLNVCFRSHKGFCQVLCIAGLSFLPQFNDYTSSKAGNERQPLNPIVILEQSRSQCS